jgi:hypothetical protein
MSNERLPDPLRDDLTRRVDYRKMLDEYNEFVAQAIEYERETGEWPPDPLLDEIDEWRREIMAEQGNGYGRVLEYYRQLDKRYAEQKPNTKGTAVVSHS